MLNSKRDFWRVGENIFLVLNYLLDFIMPIRQGLVVLYLDKVTPGQEKKQTSRRYWYWQQIVVACSIHLF